MKRNPLFVDVAEEMIAMIHSDYPPGSKIPTEPQLSEAFGVSRTTIRAAVQSLVSRNILEIRRGDGTYVTDKPGFSTEAFGFEFMNPNTISQDIGEVSVIMQPEAAALAAQRASESDLKKLRKAIDRLDAAWEKYRYDEIDYHGLRTIDAEFHNAVMKASHNQLFSRLADVMDDFSRKQQENRNIKVIEYSLKIHCRIYEAIKNSDCDAARKLMQQHMQAVNQYLSIQK